jgi:hypothetical protein
LFLEAIPELGPGVLQDLAEDLGAAIWGTDAAGETALYDAIVVALARLQAGGRDKKVLVVISDGGDNASAHSLADSEIEDRKPDR